jgi:hypothetical protein
VTTGDEWKFLKLSEDTVFIDKPSYYISGIGKIMGVLAHMLRKAQG